ncbi:MAG: tRNA (adenosine(37)-N6)-threonylcarbamoyltransferase complex ATPase subunit type 1 TsaE [Acidobacteria bacterium 13_1_40CM_3_65_5]|nr:MAG: tRNA (adenosine(37)-N6)-threonylcarbamoyltransferase complex ATPase subunit type 1 TsaE [Acidobacteria bacterium 13_1_40CM_3_65_5]
MTKTITTHSENETADVGCELAQTLTAGSVVLLFGDLGAGKTAFVRGLAEGLGVQPDEVSSPTFTLVQEYRGGRVPLFHVDLYRLNDAREIDDLGLDEIAADGVMAIEWAEKLVPDGRLKPSASARSPSRATADKSRYGDAIEVRIQHGDGDARTITLQLKSL